MGRQARAKKERAREPAGRPAAASPLTPSAGFAAAVVLAASVIAYSNSVTTARTLDDAMFSPDGPPLGGKALARLFRESTLVGLQIEGRNYRPLAMASIRLDLSTGGPKLAHAVNLGLHAAASLLVFGLALRILRDKGRPSALAGALGAALVFAVHPVHTDAVDSIFNRSEVLSTIGVAGSIWLLWAWIDRGPGAAMASLALIYLVALLCKESAAPLPALAALVVGGLRLEGRFRERVRRLAPLAATVGPLVFYFALRWQARLGSAVEFVAGHTQERMSWAGRLGLGLATAADAWRMIFWPHPLLADHDRFVMPMPLGAAIAIHLGALGAAWAMRRREPLVTVGIAFFYVALSPSAIAPFMAERFVYLPSAGLALPLAAGLAALAAARRPALLAGTAAACAVLVPMTRARNADWWNNQALWRAEVDASPDSKRGWVFLVSALLDRNPAEALAACGPATARQPKHAELYANCGTAAWRAGKIAEAERIYRQSIDLGGGATPMGDLASLFMSQGRPADAEIWFRKAIDAETRPELKHVHRATMLRALHPEDLGPARAEVQAALALSPGLLEAIDERNAVRATAAKRAQPRGE